MSKSQQNRMMLNNYLLYYQMFKKELRKVSQGEKSKFGNTGMILNYLKAYKKKVVFYIRYFEDLLDIENRGVF